MPVSRSEKIDGQLSIPTRPSLSSVPQATRNVSGKSRLLMVLTLVGAGVIGGEGCRRESASVPSSQAVPGVERKDDVPSGLLTGKEAEAHIERLVERMDSTDPKTVDKRKFLEEKEAAEDQKLLSKVPQGKLERAQGIDPVLGVPDAPVVANPDGPNFMGTPNFVFPPTSPGTLPKVNMPKIGTKSSGSSLPASEPLLEAKKTEEKAKGLNQNVPGTEKVPPKVRTPRMRPSI